MPKNHDAGQPDLDKIILQYFERKGYTAARDALVRDAPPPSADVTSFAFDAGFTSDVNVANYIMFHSAADSSPARYGLAYAAVKAWIEASLDAYRAELLALLYPLLVHMYLELMGKGMVESARDLLARYAGDHATHADELRRLGGLTAAHLGEDELVRLFTENKFTVHLCSVSFDLLLSFLQEQKLTLVLAILNSYVNLRVAGGEPSDLPEADLDVLASTVTGSSAATVSEKNAARIRWGVLADEHYVKPSSLAKAGLDKDGRATTDEEGRVIKRPKAERKLPPLPATSGPTPRLPEEVAAAAAAVKEGEEEKKEDGVVDSVPLPPLTDEFELKLLDDLRHRVELSQPGPLPSVAQFTFLNTRGGLNCIEPAHDASKIVGGFGDSSLRVWELEESTPPTEDARRHKARVKKDQHYVPLVGHAGPVYGATFSPDLNFVVSASEDSTARLWSMATSSCVAVYRGHQYPVWDVAFSPLGGYFATASNDRTARLWSTDYIYPLRVFSGHLSDVDCVAFHPNSTYVATGSSDKTVRLWDCQTGTCVRLFTGHSSPVTALAFSPSGGELASAGESGDIQMWDLAGGKKRTSLVGHEPNSVVWSLAFSHGRKGAILASGGSDHTVRLWDGRGSGDRTQDPLATLYTKNTPVTALKFTRRNVLLAGGVFAPPPPAVKT